MNENAETNGGGQITEPRLKKSYREKMITELKEKLGIENELELPRLTKIVLNMGLGLAKDDDKILSEAAEALKVISGQKPVVTRARKSVAGFKLRAGMPIGCKVTLRRGKMHEFVDRLVNVALPRIRDFRGLSPRSFDGSGNYSLGLDEITVFPEVNPDQFNYVLGLDVTICTTSDVDEGAMRLLELYGFPFRK